MASSGEAPGYSPGNEQLGSGQCWSAQSSPHLRHRCSAVTSEKESGTGDRRPPVHRRAVRR